jgi:hypothetical protein
MEHPQPLLPQYITNNEKNSIRSSRRVIRCNKCMKYIEKVTFFRILGSRNCSNLSTSGARSRAISAEQMFPKAQSASPTIY